MEGDVYLEAMKLQSSVADLKSTKSIYGLPFVNRQVVGTYN